MPRFSEEQIIGILKEQEAGAKTVDVCRKASDAKRLKALEDENAKLNRGDARQRHAEGHRLKTVVTPGAMREALAHLCSVG